MALNDSIIRSKGTPKCRWNPAEDQLLRKSIEEFGTHNWKIIATKVPGRTSKQCRERWVGKLNPDVVSSEWTEKEDNILLKLHKELGNQWAKISKHLSGRSMIAVKNRWCCLKRKAQSGKNDYTGIIPVPRDDKDKKVTVGKTGEAFNSIFHITEKAFKDLNFILDTENSLFDFSETM